MGALKLRGLLLASCAVLLAGSPLRRTAGPIGYWKVDDLASPAVDAIAGADGTWTGTVTPSTDFPTAPDGTNGVTSCGSIQLAVANASSYVLIPRSAALDAVQNGSYSLSCWFKPTSTPPTTGADSQYGVVMKAGWNEGITYNSNQNFAMYHWYGGDSTVNPIVAPTNVASNSFGTQFPPNVWYHLVGLVDQTVTPNEVRMYVNGTLVGSASTFTATPTFNLYGNESWLIGIGIPGITTGARFQADGLFDDVRIYDRALTAVEIGNLAAGMPVNDPAAPPPAAPSGLMATVVGTSVQLSWTAGAGAQRYNIKRSTTSGAETQYATSTTTSYTDLGVTLGTTYYYIVTSFGNCAESAATAEATAVMPPPPPKTPTKKRHCGCSSIGESGLAVPVIALLFALLPLILWGRRGGL